MRRILAAFCFVASPLTAQEAPRVVADIAPVRALVAQVMEGVGTPDQIIPTGASPHGYAMRPSEARALQSADLVIWVGPALTHWLEEPLDSLAGDVPRLTLMAHGGTKTLPMRDAAEIGGSHADEEDAHDHKDEEGHEDHASAEHDSKAHDDHPDHSGHAHEEHAGEDHGEEHKEEHAAEEHKDDEGHGHEHHGTIDPHGWLSPANAVLWAGVIAQELARIDPANAQTYMNNWTALSQELEGVEQELQARLAPYSDVPFIVLHDAFQYFEATFGVQARAFVIGGDGSTPGPARVKALRSYLAENRATCAFVEPQQNAALLRTAIEGQGTRVAVLDPIGDGETPYATFIRTFADDMIACFEAS